jgi:hypothetical protein
LVVANRQRAVFIAGRARVRRDEFFSRHFGHGSENARVLEAAWHQLLLNHQLALRRKIENWCGPSPATGRSKRNNNQRMRDASHPK